MLRQMKQMMKLFISMFIFTTYKNNAYNYPVSAFFKLHTCKFYTSKSFVSFIICKKNDMNTLKLQMLPCWGG